MFLYRIPLISFATLLLAAGCSSENTSYPNNSAGSDAHGILRDSTTFYFPAADSLPLGYIPPNKRPASYKMEERYFTCAFILEEASKCLVYFQAPVLSEPFLRTDIYRFLWLRSFDRPVLLTLCRDSIGTSLRTQFLNKHPLSIQITFPDPNELGIPAEEAIIRRNSIAKIMADSVIVKEIAESKRRATQVTEEETCHAITPKQWQRFQELLQQSSFWQMASCKLSLNMSDGAYWLLEAHQADGYHLVLRQSPNKSNTFRTACEYLLDLSSARKEKRY